MKIKAKNELKIKSEGELISLLKENQEKLRSLKFDLAAGKVKNVTEFRKLKKIIARILTFLNSNSAKK